MLAVGKWSCWNRIWPGGSWLYEQKSVDVRADRRYSSILLIARSPISRVRFGIVFSTERVHSLVEECLVIYTGNRTSQKRHDSSFRDLNKNYQEKQKELIRSCDHVVHWIDWRCSTLTFNTRVIFFHWSVWFTTFSPLSVYVFFCVCMFLIFAIVYFVSPRISIQYCNIIFILQKDIFYDFTESE